MGDFAWQMVDPSLHAYHEEIRNAVMFVPCIVTSVILHLPFFSFCARIYFTMNIFRNSAHRKCLAKGGTLTPAKSSSRTKNYCDAFSAVKSCFDFSGISESSSGENV